MHLADCFAISLTLGDKMKKMMITAMALAATLVAGCASMSGGAPATMKDGMMVNAKGMTLYTFDKDVAGSGKSVCNDKSNGPTKASLCTHGLKTKSQVTSLATTTSKFGTSSNNAEHTHEQF
jgi:hypothetical protein